MSTGRATVNLSIPKDIHKRVLTQKKKSGVNVGHYCKVAIEEKLVKDEAKK